MKLVALILFASLLLFGCLDQVMISTGAPEVTPESSPGQQFSTPISTPEPTISSTTTPTQTATPTISTATPSPTTTSEPTPIAPKQFETKMIVKQFDFTPKEIRVKQGTEVIIQASVPENDVTHGIALLDFGINEVIKPGEIKVLRFVADKPPGEYPFFCSVFCGSGHGAMRGKIIIE